MLDLVLRAPPPASTASFRRHDPRFGAAYARYRGTVRGALAQLGVPDADRDDLAQEVFVVLLRHLGRLADDDGEAGGLRAWIYQAARRVTANHRRAQRRRARREDAVAELLADVDGPRREAVLEATIVLARFLDELDDDGRAIFLLSEVDGRTGPEIAEALGINVNTAYARVRSVRARLRDIVDGERHAAWLALLPSALSRDPSAIAAVLAALGLAVLRVSVRKLVLGAIVAVGLGALLWLAIGRATGPGGGRPGMPDGVGGERDVAERDASTEDPPDEEPAVPGGGRTGSIAGRVATIDGAAVPGTRVCIEERRRELRPAPPRCVDADPRGAYRIDGLAPGLYALATTAPQHVEALLSDAHQRVRLVAGRNRGGVDMLLRKGGELVRGTVLDATGGVIEGALVRPDDVATATFARSDADGRFELWLDARAAPELLAHADGYASGAAELHWPARQDLELELTPEATIVGTVVDEATGRPVAGVAVISRAPLMVAYRSVADEPATITDAEGRFELRGLSPGRHHPMVQSGEWAGLASRPVLLAIGDAERDLTIAVRPARRVQGIVAFADGGAACAGARALVRDVVGDVLESSRADGEGALELGGLPPTQLRLVIECPDAMPLELDVDLGAESLLEQSWSVTRRAGVLVRGRLLGPGGDPVPLASLYATRGEPAPDGSDVADDAHTDRQGRFELGPLPAGTYDLYLRAEGHGDLPSPAKVTIAAADLDLELTASASSWLEVRTVDASGAIVPEVEVLHRDEARGGGYRVSGADGIARFDVVPGRHRFREGVPGEAGKPVDDATFADALLVELETPGDRMVDLVVARRDGTLRGRVVDEDGAPMGDARVVVLSADEMPDWFGEPKRQRIAAGWADDAGSFTIDRLVPGRYAVRAETPGGVAGKLVAAQTGGDVVVALPASGTLCGTVIVAGEAELASELAIAVRSSDDRLVRQRFVAKGGAWCIEDLARGEATVEASTIAGTATTKATVPAGGTTSGVVLNVVARGRARGRIVDADGGPVPGAFVSIASKGGGLHSAIEGARNESDADGTFDVPGPAGEVSIVVLAPGGFETRSLPALLASGTATELGDVVLARKR